MSGLERVTVMVVEDSFQIRNLICGVLRQVGVGNILRAGDGYEAINQMKEMRRNPAKVGASEVDLIIADWEMEPVDGGTLLRWVRRHQESPDKFLPFFILTGHSDEDRVLEARDLGATEFIAKPFSVDNVIAHVQATVKDERQFVKSPDYFGPDRRRKVLPVDEDHRGTAIETAKFFEPPRRLFSKVGGELFLDPEDLARAIKEVDDLQEDFTEWVKTDLEKLETNYATAKEMQDAEPRASLIRDMSTICHELRGQGGVFGYDLITVVAESLYRFSSNIIAVPDDGLKLVRTHLDMMKAIIREDISGDGGMLGPELMSSLKLANYNFIEKKDNEKLVTREFRKHARLGPQALLDELTALKSA